MAHDPDATHEPHAQPEARAHHDLGGLPAGQIDRAEHVLAPWEKEVDAMRVLLGARGLLSADELRLGIESLPAETYAALSYYERWTASILGVVVRKGLIDPAAFEVQVQRILAERAAPTPGRPAP